MTLLYFAWVRQKIGRSEEQITLPQNVRTVAQLADYLKTLNTSYREAFNDITRLRVALNQEYVGFEAPVSANDEVAFFPPVTGG